MPTPYSELLQLGADVRAGENEPLKVCRCGGTRFYRSSEKPFGLQSICADCMREASREYYRRNKRRIRRARRIAKLPEPEAPVQKRCDCGCNRFNRDARSRDGLQAMCVTYNTTHHREQRRRKRREEKWREAVRREQRQRAMISALKSAMSE